MYQNRFGFGELPLWAQKHILDDVSPPASFTKGVAAPKGRWAQRAERNASIKSIYPESTLPFWSLHGKNRNSHIM